MTAPIEGMLTAARERLAEAPREALGERREGRRLFGIQRAPRISPQGSAWHLGVLLLTDDRVLATGEILRAREEVIRGFTAESQRARAAEAAAAARGGFAEGQVVHVGWHVIDLDDLDAESSPLAVRGGIPVVRWSAAGGYQPLERYLDERIDLLLNPPSRA
jgi:hypothetical protein